MELRQLRYFLAVADARSFVNASNTLYVSRQAVSKAISQLEAELGVALFMRDSNGAFLTPAGVMFYDRVFANVRELENLREEMQRYGARYYQRVRLVFSAGSLRLYDALLSDFQEKQSNVRVEYEECPESLCRKYLTEHRADLAVCTEKPNDPAFYAEEILRDPYGLLIRDSEAIASEDSIDVTELKWLPICVRSDTQTLQFCNAHGIRPQLRGLDIFRLFSLVSEGQCGMIVPRRLIPEHWPGLRWLPLTGAEGFWSLFRVTTVAMEKNILYRTVLDELQMNVFDGVREK